MAKTPSDDQYFLWRTVRLPEYGGAHDLVLGTIERARDAAAASIRRARKRGIQVFSVTPGMEWQVGRSSLLVLYPF